MMRKFKCECGCTDYYRPEDMSFCVSFYEGHYLCSNCKTKHNYCSDAFTIIKQEQILLF